MYRTNGRMGGGRKDGESEGVGGPPALNDHVAGERGSASLLSERLRHLLLFTSKTCDSFRMCFFPV